MQACYWEGPSELPEQWSFSSAPRRDSAEPRPRGCSGLGEPRQALPNFYLSRPGRSRLRECGRRAWRLAGLSSALAFPLDLGARPLCRRLRGRGCANCQSLPQAELFVRQRERPGLHSQAVAWPPRLSAGRRESGSQRPWLGEAAPQPEGSSVCAQKAPARLGFPGALPQRRVVWMWFGAFPGASGLGRAQPQSRGSSP